MKWTVLFFLVAGILSAAPENQVGFSQVVKIRALNASDARTSSKATQTAVKRDTRTSTRTRGPAKSPTATPTATFTPSKR